MFSGGRERVLREQMGLKKFIWRIYLRIQVCTYEEQRVKRSLQHLGVIVVATLALVSANTYLTDLFQVALTFCLQELIVVILYFIILITVLYDTDTRYLCARSWTSLYFFFTSRRFMKTHFSKMFLWSGKRQIAKTIQLLKVQ